MNDKLLQYLAAINQTIYEHLDEICDNPLQLTTDPISEPESPKLAKFLHHLAGDPEAQLAWVDFLWFWFIFTIILIGIGLLFGILSRVVDFLHEEPFCERLDKVEEDIYSLLLSVKDAQDRDLKRRKLLDTIREMEWEDGDNVVSAWKEERGTTEKRRWDELV